MKTVKIETKHLLDKVKSNREKHVETHQKAREKWHEESLDILVDLHKRMRKDPRVSPPRSILDSEPTSHVDEYDRIITMLEMSVEDVIELSSQEFDMYVMDNWGWQRDFMLSTTKYLG